MLSDPAPLGPGFLRAMQVLEMQGADANSWMQAAVLPVGSTRYKERKHGDRVLAGQLQHTVIRPAWCPGCIFAVQELQAGIFCALVPVDVAMSDS